MVMSFRASFSRVGFCERLIDSVQPAQSWNSRQITGGAFGGLQSVRHCADALVIQASRTHLLGARAERDRQAAHEALNVACQSCP
jgi:hypothetical protein